MEGTPQSSQEPEPSDPNSFPRSQEEKDAAKRRLKPHSRSQIALDKAAIPKPEVMTPLPAKKPKSTKWQFGIRSRNSPCEAMLALYKALKVLGAEWEVPRIRQPRSRIRSRGSASSSVSSDEEEEEEEEYYDDEGGLPLAEDDDQQNWSEEEGFAGANSRGGSAISVDRGRRTNRRQNFGPHNDWGYEVPADPWVIHARFKIFGRHGPGSGPGNSSHSSRVDLTAVDEELERRKEEEKDQDGHAVGFGTAVKEVARQIKDLKLAEAVADADTHATSSEAGEDILHVYLTIQLYTIDTGHYLVDFKSSGYERLAKEVVKEAKVDMPAGGVEWRLLREGERPEDVGGKGVVREREVLVGQGRAEEDKDATSPFPFLDVASRLVAELAEGRHQERKESEQ
jgi:carbon catabolite-derepressing protein kinase